MAGRLRAACQADTPSPLSMWVQEGERQVPEFFLQNVLAVGLITLLGLSVGSVLLKLAFVTYALLAAAFRYTVVAFLIIVLFALFT